MSKREVGFLLIGIGLGLLLSLAVILEVMLTLRNGSYLSSFSFDKFIFLIPAFFIVLGVILLAYRTETERDSQ